MSIRLDLLAAHFSQSGPVIWLDSQSDSHKWSQFSYLAALPRAELIAHNRSITIRTPRGEKQLELNPWVALEQFRREYSDWLFGYLGYELKNNLENLQSRNVDSVGAPDLYMMVPEFLLKVDHQKGKTELLHGKLPAPDELDYFSKECNVEDLKTTISRETYLGRIREVQEHILEGDFYELNLSHQLQGDFSGNPLQLYRLMRSAGPVPFGAYLHIPEVAICCQSPERFLRKEGNDVFSQPIKGTSSRSENPEEDRHLKKTLHESDKEQAENLMIVDLVRNDLSRVARTGSVTVDELFSIESFETVHQMVSTVRAEVVDYPPEDILKACFPMGSMTGAPKISAMKAIEKLENYRRGIYSGAIGYFTPNGDFDFNVVIRTAVIRKNKIFYASGGAITSDSDPEKEWEETLLKTRALTDVISSEIMESSAKRF